MTATKACYLANLQQELLLEIRDHLLITQDWERDLLSWSATSSKFRSFLTPYLFDSITLRNTEKRGAQVEAFARSRCRHDVKTLRFAGTILQDEDAEEGNTDIDSVLPENVERVLSDLSVFPNLEMVRIGLEMEFEDDEETELRAFEKVETFDDVELAEQREPWRAPNTKMYAALARNVNPGFRYLVLDELVPVKASSFRSPEFRKLLGHMERFSVSP
jgi:hypothetical protein